MALERETEGFVQTLVGTGLFDWGDKDGAGRAAQFQHPQGIAYANGRLLVSDTYNHRIKALDPATFEVMTAAGTGQRGWHDGQRLVAAFEEPGGLSLAGTRAYIADTNNHLVRILDLATGEVSTLTLSNLGILSGPATALGVDLPSQTVAPGATTLRLDSARPRATTSTARGLRCSACRRRIPQCWNWASANSPGRTEDGSIALPVPAIASAGTATVTGRASVYYCRTGSEALCLVQSIDITLPVEVREGATAGEISGEVRLPPVED